MILIQNIFFHKTLRKRKSVDIEILTSVNGDQIVRPHNIAHCFVTE